MDQKAYKLRECYFWNAYANSCSSCIWKSILKSRSVAVHFVSRVKARWRWNALRLVWHSAVIPKHAVVAWMEILGKLPTLDRMRSRALSLMQLVCYVVCKMKVGTMCFFECSYSKDLWEQILQCCGLSKPVFI